MKTLLIGLTAGLTLGLSTPVFADDMHHGAGLMVKDAWSRVTTPGAKVGGGYLTLHNGGEMDDRLLSVSAPHAGKTEIHSMIMQDDVMIMRPVDEALTIEAGGMLSLEPGGLHLMFMQLEAPHVVGEPLTAVLTFDHAGDVEVEFEVLSMRHSMERSDHGAHGSHGHGSEAHGE